MPASPRGPPPHHLIRPPPTRNWTSAAPTRIGPPPAAYSSSDFSARSSTRSTADWSASARAGPTFSERRKVRRRTSAGWIMAEAEKAEEAGEAEKAEEVGEAGDAMSTKRDSSIRTAPLLDCGEKGGSERERGEERARERGQREVGDREARGARGGEGSRSAQLFALRMAVTK
ncbi:hypothetical protein DFH09DRAFT_1090601 [Mycena vulgaris]|nr:hypothetical protein DFH09DRAFT_1090601 [Mycena vulgaris]